MTGKIDGNTHYRATVLIVSDELETARVWGFTLGQLGLEVTLTALSDTTLKIWAELLPDLIIFEDFNTLDEELELCRQLRAETAAPILYLTSKTSEAFLLDVYKAGADECIPLPISHRLFLAKVRAWLRYIQGLPMAALGEISAAGFLLNPNLRRVTTPSGGILRLTILETRLLFLLMGHAGRVHSVDALVEGVWGLYHNGDRALLKNLVYRLRRKLEPDPGRPRFLMTEGNLGYKFVADSDRA
jgi:DNA-binding response OmpR family regulator